MVQSMGNEHAQYLVFITRYKDSLLSRCTNTEFSLDETWQETTADGRETSTIAKLEDNKLIKDQVGVA